ncbi:cell division protein FtsL [Mucilaginibacter sp. UYP25]
METFIFIVTRLIMAGCVITIFSTAYTTKGDTYLNNTGLGDIF